MGRDRSTPIHCALTGMALGARQGQARRVPPRRQIASLSAWRRRSWADWLEADSNAFYGRRFQSTGLLGQRKHVTNQSSTYIHGGQLMTIASRARMIANARTDSASARAPSLQNGRGA